MVDISHQFKYKVAALAAWVVLAAGLVAVVSAAEFPVGSGPDNWWITYPDQSPASGSDVNHPDWVLEALQDKPVLIYAHLECDYCVPQTEAINEILDEYGEEIEFYEIPGGSDGRIAEAFEAYDHDGGTSSVPLTVIITLVTGEDGKAEVAWQSTEKVTGKKWIEERVEDAINLHQENVSDWDA